MASIVGSYEQVAERLDDLVALGAEAFILAAPRIWKRPTVSVKKYYRWCAATWICLPCGR